MLTINWGILRDANWEPIRKFKEYTLYQLIPTYKLNNSAAELVFLGNIHIPLEVQSDLGRLSQL